MSVPLTSLPPIYFYIQRRDWLDTFPENANIPWPGFGQGIYCWTLQTYLELRSNGFPCELCDYVPESGIIFVHRASINFNYYPRPGQLIVCFNADRGPHPYAQVNIVQNSVETKRVRNSYYMPLWPQPGLIPRNPSRGNQVVNVVYMGISYNLAPELIDSSWATSLSDLGLTWQIRNRELWHDYSEVDAIVAVRRFKSKVQYDWKPATKLYNSWHAEVPAILGVESGFRAERQSPLDYIEVDSVVEALAALKRFKTDPQYYSAMVQQSKQRSQLFDRSHLKQKWQNFITDTLVPQYMNWVKSSNWRQQLYLRNCYLATKIYGIRRRLLGTDPAAAYKL